MAGFDGNGNYVRPYNWTNDAANGLPIDATKFDTDGNDVATAFGLCLTRDNQGKPTAPLIWTQPLSVTQFNVTGGTADSNALIIADAGSRIAMSRSSDGSRHFYVGGKTVTSSAMSIWNDGGSGSEMELAAADINFKNNAASVWGNLNTSTGAWKFWEGVYNIGTAGLFPAVTNENGSFTATLTGCTTSPTATVFYRRSGPIVTLNMDVNLTATSNTTACTLTGMSAALAPAKSQRAALILEDNGAFQAGSVTISAGVTTLSLLKGDSSAFTNSGTKGVASFTISYSLI